MPNQPANLTAAAAQGVFLDSREDRAILGKVSVNVRWRLVALMFSNIAHVPLSAIKRKTMKKLLSSKIIAVVSQLSIVGILGIITAGCCTSPQRDNTAATHSSGLGSVTHAETKPLPESTITCRKNLRAIEGAKDLWALENRKHISTVPDDADLFGENRYMPVKPTCLDGGHYTLRAVDLPPLCSITGHVY